MMSISQRIVARKATHVKPGMRTWLRLVTEQKPTIHKFLYRLARPSSTSTLQQSLAKPSRMQEFQNRLPKFLQSYTKPLINSPISHITAFLFLHEVTAVLPLFGLAGCFHYYTWLPKSVGEGITGRYLSESVDKFGRYFRKKGWIGSTEEQQCKDDNMAFQSKKLSEGSRLVMEFAAAYAITKALLPLRIMLSVWATPWFARTTIAPVLKLFKKY